MKNIRLVSKNMESHNIPNNWDPMEEGTDVLCSCIIFVPDWGEMCIYQEKDGEVYTADWNPPFGLRCASKATQEERDILLK